MAEGHIGRVWAKLSGNRYPNEANVAAPSPADHKQLKDNKSKEELPIDQVLIQEATALVNALKMKEAYGIPEDRSIMLNQAMSDYLGRTLLKQITKPLPGLPQITLPEKLHKKLRTKFPNHNEEYSNQANNQFITSEVKNLQKALYTVAETTIDNTLKRLSGVNPQNTEQFLRTMVERLSSNSRANPQDIYTDGPLKLTPVDINSPFTKMHRERLQVLFTATEQPIAA